MARQDVLDRLRKMRSDMWEQMNGTARYMVILCIRSLERET